MDGKFWQLGFNNNNNNKIRLNLFNCILGKLTINDNEM